MHHCMNFSNARQLRSMANKNINIVFRTYLREKWINGPFYIYRLIHFISGNAAFF